MHRTTVMLPASLKNRAQMFALKKGISVGELIRESLESALDQEKLLKKTNSFFEDKNFFTGDVPTDLSEKHDEYLYDNIH